MIYTYHCYGGTHSSVLASAYHLNYLDRSREPSREEILELHNFNELIYKNRGNFFFQGTDEEGNKVYTIGRGRSKILIPGLYSMVNMLQKEGVLKEKIVFSNTSPTVPAAMTFGGFFSRWAKIDFIGVPLLVKGAQQTYKNSINLVDFTKEISKKDVRNIIFLDNGQFISSSKLKKN